MNFMNITHKCQEEINEPGFKPGSRVHQSEGLYVVNHPGQSNAAVRSHDHAAERGPASKYFSIHKPPFSLPTGSPDTTLLQ